MSNSLALIACQIGRVPPTLGKGPLHTLHVFQKKYTSVNGSPPSGSSTTTTSARPLRQPLKGLAFSKASLLHVEFLPATYPAAGNGISLGTAIYASTNDDALPSRTGFPHMAKVYQARGLGCKVQNKVDVVNTLLLRSRHEISP
jgi:hypothetical protein